MLKNKVWQFVLSMIIIALLATACTQTPPEVEAPAEEAPIEEEAAEEVEVMDLALAISSPHVWIQPVIAECQGYYEEVGLNVELVRFTSGRAAMDALIGGQTELATTAISPAILAAFQDQKIAIIADNARFPDEKITARVESGIAAPEDLAGKKIGVTLGSDNHYFLLKYLNHYGITEDQVEIINLGATDMVISLVRGDIDAFASWRPQPDNAKAEMGDGAIFLEQPDPIIFESLYLIVGMQDLVSENPEAYERFMKAMIMADEFAATNPDETTQCVADFSEVDFDTAADLMKGYQFKIWLDQSLIEGSEERAVWQMANDIAPEGVEMPNFRDFIVEGPLEAVAPDRVSLD